MLPNHAPLVVAEQFAMLEALASGTASTSASDERPGTDQLTAAALRRSLDAAGRRGLPAATSST